MKRRRFLGTAGVVAAAGLSGCLGYTLTEESRIDELEARLDDRNAQLTELTQDLSEADARIEELETNLDTAQANVKTSEENVRETVVSIYRLAVDAIVTAEGEYVTGREAWRTSEYRVSLRRFATAKGYYDMSVEAATDAETVCDVYDFNQAAAIAQDAAQYGGHMRKSADEMLTAVEYVLDDDIELAEEHRTMAESHRTDAQAYGVDNANMFRESLESDIKE